MSILPRLPWIVFGLLPFAVSQRHRCTSYGVDFVDDAHYFINGASWEPFTCVSTFRGCQSDDVADILLIRPDGSEINCTQVRTVPDEERMLSVCGVRKSEMKSGHWRVLIIGNNGEEGAPFAWQRDLHLTVGTQVTVTTTPTRTFTETMTPTETRVMISPSTLTKTTGSMYTVTLPGAAAYTRTITPAIVTATATRTKTKTTTTSSKSYTVITTTETAKCITPPRPSRKDKVVTVSPTGVHIKAMGSHNDTVERRADRTVDYKWARDRVGAAKQRKAVLERRAPDPRTLTVKAKGKHAITTVTKQDPTVTETETSIQKTTTTIALPPETVYAGALTSTVTLPTRTHTETLWKTVTATRTKTWAATFTNHVTVTPAADSEACRRQGGYYREDWE